MKDKEALLRHWGLLGLAGALATMGAIALVLWLRAQGSRPVDVQAGEELYAIALDDADGNSQALSQWKGKLLVVNFWATWCAPCVAEMPELDRIQQEYAGRNIAVVGIGLENREKVRQFRDRLGLHLPLLAGGFDSLALARTFGDVEGVLPYTAMFSGDGRLLHAHTGALPPGQLRQWFDAAQ